MNIVIKTLREYITRQDVRFVFPSEIAARLWAQKTCTLGIARSVAADRFLAWDRFKEEAARKRETNREPVSQITRKLFADALIRKNANVARDTARRADAVRAEPAPEGFPLRALIPVEHAQGGAVFASFIARLLPSLSSWERLRKNAVRGAARNGAYNATHNASRETGRDDEDRDLELIKKEYAAFLERHNLFEPSWEEINIQEGRYRYVLFFPELVEDFAEYDALLKAPRFIRAGLENAPPETEKPVLRSFNSAREEIRSAVMEMRRFHEEEGVPYEDMAVSVPELEEIEPYLLKECALRDIPVTRRAGKKLGETGAGRFFSLVSGYASSRFSFDSLKALVLNDHIPWKEKEKNSALIRFGIKYNCVLGYNQNGKTVDIWEEALKEAYNDGGRELKPYYGELKKYITAFMNAESFSDIRKCYFTFRGVFLDMEKITKEDDAVLSRCIEELGSLVDLEEKLRDPELVPASPLAFFLSCLGEKEYVPANQKPGINIFRWRVAAAAPFACHFVLNASQSAAPVLYQPMKFLRQDKRKLLGLEDTDASGAFFILCDTGEDEIFRSRTRISSSAQTFSGWAIPHSFFAQGKIVEAPPASKDPYTEERRFWREPRKSGGAAARNTLADGNRAEGETTENRGGNYLELFSPQKHSYDFWKSALVQKENNFSLFVSPVPAGSPARELLVNHILGADGYLAVTPTRDLNLYYECAQKWLYSRVFGAGEFSLEAALLDDTSLGLLYHKILEKLFAKIRDEDGAFYSGHLDIYKRRAAEITIAAIKEHRAFRGPLAVPLVSPQAAGMAKKIARLLELEAAFFDGYKVAALELRVSQKTGDVLIEGVVDRVSVSPNGEAAIIDYKTKYLPGQSAAEDIEKDGLLEFQMPLYVKLYEENFSEVKGAYFYSVADRKIKTVMGEKNSGRTRVPDRGEYAVFLAAAEKQIEEFAQKVHALDFVPGEVRIKNCLECAYKTACRSVYSC